MSNFKVHSTIGVVSSIGVELLQLMREEGSVSFKVGLCRCLIAGAGGLIGASTPDLLEPATSYDHRSVFHSVCAGGAVVYGAYSTMSENKLINNQFASAFIRGTAVGYGSHLVLDMTTSMGLPFFKS